MNATALKMIYEAQLREDLTAPVHEHVDRRATQYMLQLSTILPARTFRETDGKGIWIWSDLHLGHADSVWYFDRPFIDPEHMDQALHRAWTRTVDPGDTIICLGDVALPELWGRQLKRLRAAPARKILAFGNHDVNRLGRLNVEGFEEVHETLFVDGDPRLLMTHMPLRHVPNGLVNVHGHTHNAPLTRTRHVDVSVEQIRYRPVEFEKIRRLACELAAGRYPAGETTAERLDNLPTHE